MSLHPRKQIRDAIVTALLTKTGAGTRVYPNRVRPWRAKNLPAIGVYTKSEEANHHDSAPRAYERRALVVVEIVADADDHLDDVLDLQALLVETILLADPTMGGVADDLVLSDSSLDFLEKGDTLQGCCAITFEATYWTEQPEPTLDDFETANVEWDVATPDGQIEAVDTITMPTEEEA